MNSNIILYHKTLMIFHIVLGFISLVSFWLSLCTFKYRIHKTLGKIFFYSVIFNTFVSISISLTTIAYPLIVKPNRLISDSIFYSVLLIYMSFFPLICSLISKRIIDAGNIQRSFAVYNYAFILFFLCGFFNFVMGFIGNNKEIALNGFISNTWITLIYYNFIKEKKSLKSIKSKKLIFIKYHARFFINAGIALHISFIAGGASVKFFNNEQFLKGYSFYMPFLIGIIFDLIIVYIFNRKIQKINSN